MSKRKALLVGINYAGTGNELRGCLNDVQHVKSMLIDTYKFTEVRTLLERAGTTEAILSELQWLTSDTEDGDVILFYFSGHGSQIPSVNELDGYEEIICPYDLDWRSNVITDNDLKAIFNAQSKGVNTTVILDCCHSGTALNQENQYMPDLQVLSKHVLRTSNVKYMAPPFHIHTYAHLVQFNTERDINTSALLIAACEAQQLAADAFIDGIFQGAATAAMIQSTKNTPNISYRALVDQMVGFMLANDFQQRPELDGALVLHDQEFLKPFTKNKL